MYEVQPMGRGVYGVWYGQEVIARFDEDHLEEAQRMARLFNAEDRMREEAGTFRNLK